MATQTLIEAAKFINNQIVAGVVEDIITINPIYSFLPFMDYQGQAIVVNREEALGDAGFYSVGSQITDKNPGSYTNFTFTATKIIGDVEMDGLVQAQSESAGTDQTAIEISSKAKKIGRLYQQGMATGDGATPNMNSLHSLVDSSQYTSPSNGQPISFKLLRDLLELVTAKDGEVDWIMMHGRTVNSLWSLYEAMGGAAPTMTMTLPNGATRIVPTFMNIPVFTNNYLSTTETANGAAITGGALASVYAGCWDDGSAKVGVAGIHPAGIPAGVVVKPIGEREDYDAMLWRVLMYSNFSVFNRRGLARLTSINN